jgi:hypothetical protein
MEHRMRRVASIAALLWLLISMSEDGATLAQSDGQTAPVNCVKRQTDMTSRGPAVPPPGGVTAQGQVAPGPKLMPVCPPGEIPVVTPPAVRTFPKGNPLIGSDAGQSHSQGDFGKRNLLRPFDQVYWKRGPTPAQQNSEVTKSSSHAQ